MYVVLVIVVNMYYNNTSNDTLDSDSSILSRNRNSNSNSNIDSDSGCSATSGAIDTYFV